MQYEKHKSARKIFSDIDKNPSKYLIIHYSCESFYDIKDGHTPRITSIAVYDYTSVSCHIHYGIKIIWNYFAKKFPIFLLVLSRININNSINYVLTIKNVNAKIG